MATEYYIQLSGVTGAQAIALDNSDGGTWIRVDGYSFGLEADTVRTGSTIVSGKPVPDNLTLTLDSTAGLTDVLKQIAQGKQFASATLIGVDNAGGQRHVVETIDLQNAFVTHVAQDQVADGEGQGYSLSLVYKAIQQSYASQNATTQSYKAAGAVGWDVTTGQVSNATVGLAAKGQVASITPVAGYGAAHDLYVKIAGVTGEVLAKGYEGWSEVESYSFAVDAETSYLKGTGAAIGKPNFGDLHLTMRLGPSELAYMRAAIAGTALSSLTLDGVDARGQSVSDLTLKTAYVTSLKAMTDGDGGTFYDVGLTYGQIGLNEHAQTQSEPITSSFGYNLLTGALTTVQATPSDSVRPVIFAAATEYYIQLSGITGAQAIALDNSDSGTWIRVDGYSFGLEADTVRTGSTIASGKPIPDNLTLTLDNTAGLTDVLKQIAQGKQFASATLIGVDKDNVSGQKHVVETIDLQNAFVTHVAQDQVADGEGQGYSLSLVYKAIQQSYVSQGATTGSYKAAGAINWDVTTGQVSNTTAGFAAKAQVASIAPVTGYGAAHDLYVKIAGVTGEVTAKGHEGWSEVESYSFAVDAETSYLKGTGAAIGKPNFGDLHLTMRLGPSELAYMRAAIAGTALSSLTLDVVDGQGQSLSDLTLKTAYVTSLKAMSDGDGRTLYDVSLIYGQIGLNEHAQTQTQSEPISSSFGYNSLTSALTTVQATPSDSVKPVGFATATEYYIQLSGVTGEQAIALDKSDSGTWIKVDGYSFGLEANTVRTGGKIALGKPNPDNLTLTLGSTAGLTDVLKQIVQGKQFTSATLIGVDNAGGQRHVVETIDLQNAFVTHIAQDEAADGDGQDYSLSLVYKAIQQSYASQDATTRSYKAAGAVGWDVTTGQVSNTTVGFAAKGQVASITPTANYRAAHDLYVKIAGVTGDVTAKGYEGWSEVESYSFAVDAETSYLKGTGAAIGKPNFGDLHLTMRLGPSELAYMRAAIAGTALSSLTLDEVDARGQSVSDLTLKTAYVTSLKAMSDGDGGTFYDVGLTYNNISLTNFYGKYLNTNFKGSASADINVATLTVTGSTANLPPEIPVTPTLTLTTDSGKVGDGITNKAGLTFAGVDAGASLSVSIDGGPSTASYDPTGLKDGLHIVTLTQTDTAGNTSAAGSISFLLDTAVPLAPTLALTTDSGSSTTDGITSKADLTVTGLETGASLSYSVDGGAPSATYNTSQLAEGKHTVSVTQTDIAGNTSAAGSVSFVLDTKVVAPTLALTTDADVVSLSGTNAVATATTTTLNAADQLDGGGHGTLALLGGGGFDLAGLQQFTGFQGIKLTNATASGATLVLRDGANLTVTLDDGTLANPATNTLSATGGIAVTLAKSVVAITGGNEADSFTAATPAQLTAGSTFDGGGGRDSLSLSYDFAGHTGTFQFDPTTGKSTFIPPASLDTVYDLTKVGLSHVESLFVNGPGATNGGATVFKIDAASLKDVTTLGLNSNAVLTTEANNLDLTGKGVLGFGGGTITSANATGTTFTTDSAAVAALIQGGAGQDTVILNGASLTAIQRATIFAGSVETITDASGTYTKPIAQTLKGKAVDGYLAGATVFADANGNGQLDGGEASTVTDGQGNFTLVNGSGTIVTQGGTDISTGLAFVGTLKAPAGSTVVTPLTTVAVALAAQGIADPIAAANIAFGLPVGYDLAHTDPVSGSVAGDGSALTALKAGAAVANTLAQITAGLQAGGATAAAAEASAVAALAGYVAANTTVDLTGVTAVTAVATSAGLAAGTAGTIGMAAAGTNATLAAAGDAIALAAAQALAQSGGSNGGQAGGTNPGPIPIGTTVPVLSVYATVDGLINASEAKAVSFTVTGLASSTSAVATFSDGTHTQKVTVGANGNATVDLSGFDGTVTSSLSFSGGGQVPTTVDGVSVLVDTTAPAPSVTAVSGAGNHASGHLVSGNLAPADAGLTVTVRDGGAVLGTAVSDGQGHFSFAFTDTKPGAVHSYDLTVTATDAAGNVGASGTSHFAFDYTANASLFGAVTHDASSHLGQVYALYEGLLGRAPDQAGLRAWVDALDHGGSLKDVTQGFLASPEARGHLGTGSNAAFVDSLYAGVLNRAADAGGRQGHIDVLAQGMSRAEVADSFVFSPEHLEQLRDAYSAGIAMGDPIAEGVARLYHGLLDRAPDAAGLSGWTAVAHAGQPLSAIAAGILGSQEYVQQHAGESDAAFVEGLYQHALGRAAEPAGEQWQLSALSYGTSRADLALSVTESAEAQAHLAGSVGSGWHLV